MTEQELAGYVITYLRDEQWEVYQEVQMRQDGIVADIVATRAGLIWVIECKRTLGLAVLAQAYRWRPYANLVSAAVPANHIGGNFLRDLLAWSGMGMLDVWHGGETRQSFTPTMRRRIAPNLLHSLRDEQKTWAPAGNSNSARYTPFKATSLAVTEYVNANPGRTIRQIVVDIQHHYASDASARGALIKWALDGKIAGIEARRIGQRLLLFPTEKVKP